MGRKEGVPHYFVFSFILDFHFQEERQTERQGGKVKEMVFKCSLKHPLSEILSKHLLTFSIGLCIKKEMLHSLIFIRTLKRDHLSLTQNPLHLRIKAFSCLLPPSFCFSAFFYIPCTVLGLCSRTEPKRGTTKAHTYLANSRL